MPRANYPQFLDHLLPELLVSLHGSPASVSRVGRLRPAIRQCLVSVDSGLSHLLVRNEGPSGASDVNAWVLKHFGAEETRGWG